MQQQTVFIKEKSLNISIGVEAKVQTKALTLLLIKINNSKENLSNRLKL